MFSSIKHRLYNLLKWSEKYTKTDMIYLARGSFWMSSSQILSFVSMFFIAAAFANLIPRETYGQYKYILSTVGLFGIFTLQRMGTSYLLSVTRGFDGGIVKIMKTQITWGLIGSLGSLCLSIFYLTNDSNTLGLSFLIASIFIPFYTVADIYTPFLNGKKEFRTVAIYKTIFSAIIATVLITTIYFTNNILIILISFFLSHTIAHYLLYKRTMQKFSSSGLQESGTISYGKHLSLMSVLSDIAGKIDSILLWHFLGAVPVAIYSFALVPVNRFESLIRTPAFLAYIKIPNLDKAQLKKTLPKKALRATLLSIPIVFLYILLAPFIFQFFFPQYLDAIIFTQVLATGILLWPYQIFQSALTAYKKKQELYILNTTSALFAILLLFVLLPIFGLWGAVIVYLFSRSLRTSMTLYFFFKI